MAEAIVAFVLAATIIKFIHFGSKLVSELWSICQDDFDISKKTFHHQSTTNDLRIILADLKSSAKCVGSKTESQKSLEELVGQCSELDGQCSELVGQCSELADEMLAALEDFTPSEKRGKRGNLKALFRLIWTEDKIKSQQAKLETINGRLRFLVSVSSRGV